MNVCFCLLLSLWLVWYPAAQAVDAADLGIAQEVNPTGQPGSISGLDGDTVLAGEEDGMEPTEDWQQGMDGIMDIPLSPYQLDDITRRQEDSELARFALVAALAIWASRTITQRRRS